MPKAKTHPTPQQLANYSLGKLPPAELSAIHAHVAGCPECRQVVENQPPDSFIGQLRGGARGASMLPTLPPSPSSTALPARKAADARTDDVPPELLGCPKFEILGKLGQGGMGAVYKARHTFLNELVAIKVMSAAVVENAEARTRFLREMQATAQLKHANIVRALDAEQMGELLVLVMEFVPGIALDRLVKQRGPLPVELACDLIVQAARGLQHAHEKGMVHRDIKPANLMIMPKEKEVKILDFGLARGPSVQTAARQTQMQAFMGTPEYVAPEQATDARNVDIRADIYSLGCSLYCLLAGRPPFKGDSVMSTIMAHLQDEAQPLTEVRKDVPAALSTVVAKMMAKKPEERYQTPIEVAKALQPFAQGGTARGAEARAKTVVHPGVPPAPTAGIPSAPPPKEKESPFEFSAAPVAQGARPRTPREKVNGKKKRPAWMVGAALACGVMTVALLSLLVLTFRTAEGKLVVEIDQKDAQVFVDGKEISIRVPGDMQPIEIHVDEGKHALLVKKDGFAVETREFTYRKGKTNPIRVTLKRQTQVARDGDVKPPVRTGAPPVNPVPKPPAPAPGEPKSTPTTPAPQRPVPPPSKPQPVFSREVTNSIGMKLVRIKAGTFTMGSSKKEQDVAIANYEKNHGKKVPEYGVAAYRGEGPQHEVEISKAFWLGVHEVTQKEFKAVMKYNPSHFSKDGKSKAGVKYFSEPAGGKEKVPDDTGDFPVDNVSWVEAKEFCEQLTKTEGNGRLYRLPTEAEWEYACRGGADSSTTFHYGNSLSSEQANCIGNYPFGGTAKGKHLERTCAVGSYKPNAFGLYDMHGNVWEWCSDWYGADYYTNRRERDPAGPSWGSDRVLRGGSWYESGQDCRSARRRRNAPADRYGHLGFRAALVPSK